jgi:hypothetical protein
MNNYINNNINYIIAIIGIGILILLFTNSESFQDIKCSNIKPGSCTSELCSSNSNCKISKTEDDDICFCKERE